MLLKISSVEINLWDCRFCHFLSIPIPRFEVSFQSNHVLIFSYILDLSTIISIISIQPFKNLPLLEVEGWRLEVRSWKGGELVDSGAWHHVN